MPHSNYCTAKFRTSILMTRTSGQRRFREVDIIFEEVAGPCAIAMPAFQLVPSTCVDLQQSWQACPRPWLGHTGVAERGYVNLGPFKTKNVPGILPDHVEVANRNRQITRKKFEILLLPTLFAKGVVAVSD